MEIPNDRLALNADEVSRSLGISARTLFRLTKRKDKPIPHIKQGRRLLYPVDRLKQWMSENTITGK